MSIARPLTRQQIKQFRSDPELDKVETDAELSQVIDGLNKTINAYNFLSKFISFQSNMDGYIAEDISIAAGATVSIQHYLGVKPKWRIILKQEGNGVISDVPSQWNDKIITLTNNGSVSVIITVFIARE